MAEDSAAARYSSEFLGTFFLVFTVGCNVLAGSPVWAATSIACVLMATVYAFGSISGANFNPAVSLSLGLSGKLAWSEVGVYTAVQLVAGGLAGVAYKITLDDAFALGPATGFDWWQAALAELLYTFVLCFVVLNVAASGRHAGREQFYGLAIGFVIVAGGYSGGHISGGCFNPAVAAGVAVSSASVEAVSSWALYTAAEIAGACLASVFFRLCRPEDFGADPADGSPLSARLISEFLGTFVLVLTVGLNVLGQSPAAAFSIAASLMCMIFALGTVSGAHFNPAVTVAVVCAGRGKCSPSDAGAYIGAQLLGGVCGALLYSTMENGNSFALEPGLSYGWPAAMAGELVFTALLALVVLSVATVDHPLSEYFGLAIGACVIVGGCAVGAVSGGSLNPAVSVGITTAHALNGGAFQNCVIYSGIELVGGVVAAGMFMLTHPSEYSK